MKPLSQAHQSIIFAALAVIFFNYGGFILGTMGKDFPVLELALVWYIAAFGTSLLFTILTGRLLPDLRKIKQNPRRSAALITIGACEGFFWFFTLLAIGLSGISIVGRLSTILLFAFGLFVLKESYDTRQKFWMYVMIFAGILFIPGMTQQDHFLAYLLPLFFALFTTAYVIAKKYCADLITGLTPHMLRAGLILSFVYSFYIYTKGTFIPQIDLPLYVILLTMSGGVSNAVIGQYMRMKSLSNGGKLSAVSTVMNTGPVLGFLVGIGLMGEEGNIWKYTAAALMFTAIFAMAVPRRKLIKARNLPKFK